VGAGAEDIGEHEQDHEETMINKTDDRTAATQPFAHGPSLRNYFAGQATVGLLAAMAHPSSSGFPWPESLEVAAHKIADKAFAIADAMIDKDHNDDYLYALRMLAGARCPDPHCNNRGIKANGNECEWCYRREEAIAPLRGA
jgi:hypothetical protein